jgi:hypothetical protein
VQEVDRLGWAVTVGLRAGEFVIGVRCDSRETAELIATVFAPRLQTEAQDVPPNLSLKLVSRTSTAGGAGLHLVFDTYRRLVRTRSVDRALEAVWHVLDMHDQAAVGEDGPVLRATIVVDEHGGAHVFPARLRNLFLDRDRAWGKAGFRLIDRPAQRLDLAGGTLHVPRAAVGSLAPSEIAVGEWFAHQPEPPRPAGELVIRSWSPDVWGSTGPAGRVVGAARQVTNRRSLAGGALLSGLAGLLERTPDVASFEDRAHLERLLRSVALQGNGE